jgi:hypothetical protein
VSWGYFQERIMTIDYGKGDKFDNSEFLVFLNRIAAVVCILIISLHFLDVFPPIAYSPTHQIDIGIGPQLGSWSTSIIGTTICIFICIHVQCYVIMVSI